MPYETPTESVEDDVDALDESSLAGISEYSATGGGAQPLHMPRLRSMPELADEPEAPDSEASFGELYRYSLGRATQGVRLVRFKIEGDRVASVGRMLHDDSEVEEPGEGDGAPPPGPTPTPPPAT